MCPGRDLLMMRRLSKIFSDIARELDFEIIKFQNVLQDLKETTHNRKCTKRNSNFDIDTIFWKRFPEGFKSHSTLVRYLGSFPPEAIGPTLRSIMRFLPYSSANYYEMHTENGDINTDLFDDFQFEKVEGREGYDNFVADIRNIQLHKDYYLVVEYIVIALIGDSVLQFLLKYADSDGMDTEIAHQIIDTAMTVFFDSKFDSKRPKAPLFNDANSDLDQVLAEKRYGVWSQIVGILSRRHFDYIIKKATHFIDEHGPRPQFFRFLRVVEIGDGDPKVAWEFLTFLKKHISKGSLSPEMLEFLNNFLSQLNEGMGPADSDKKVVKWYHKFFYGMTSRNNAFKPWSIIVVSNMLNHFPGSFTEKEYLSFYSKKILKRLKDSKKRSLYCIRALAHLVYSQSPYIGMDAYSHDGEIADSALDVLKKGVAELAKPTQRKTYSEDYQNAFELSEVLVYIHRIYSEEEYGKVVKGFISSGDQTNILALLLSVHHIVRTTKQTSILNKIDIYSLFSGIISGKKGQASQYSRSFNFLGTKDGDIFDVSAILGSENPLQEEIRTESAAQRQRLGKFLRYLGSFTSSESSFEQILSHGADGIGMLRNDFVETGTPASGERDMDLAIVVQIYKIALLMQELGSSIVFFDEILTDSLEMLLSVDLLYSKAAANFIYGLWKISKNDTRTIVVDSILNMCRSSSVYYENGMPTLVSLLYLLHRLLLEDTTAGYEVLKRNYFSFILFFGKANPKVRYIALKIAKVILQSNKDVASEDPLWSLFEPIDEKSIYLYLRARGYTLLPSAIRKLKLPITFTLSECLTSEDVALWLTAFIRLAETFRKELDANTKDISKAVKTSSELYRLVKGKLSTDRTLDGWNAAVTIKCGKDVSKLVLNASSSVVVTPFSLFLHLFPFIYMRGTVSIDGSSDKEKKLMQKTSAFLSEELVQKIFFPHRNHSKFEHSLLRALLIFSGASARAEYLESIFSMLLKMSKKRKSHSKGGSRRSRLFVVGEVLQILVSVLNYHEPQDILAGEKVRKQFSDLDSEIKSLLFVTDLNLKMFSDYPGRTHERKLISFFDFTINSIGTLQKLLELSIIEDPDRKFLRFLKIFSGFGSGSQIFMKVLNKAISMSSTNVASVKNFSDLREILSTAVFEGLELFTSVYAFPSVSDVAPIQKWLVEAEVSGHSVFFNILRNAPEHFFEYYMHNAQTSQVQETSKLFLMSIFKIFDDRSFMTMERNKIILSHNAGKLLFHTLLNIANEDREVRIKCLEHVELTAPTAYGFHPNPVWVPDEKFQAFRRRLSADSNTREFKSVGRSLSVLAKESCLILAEEFIFEAFDTYLENEHLLEPDEYVLELVEPWIKHVYLSENPEDSLIYQIVDSEPSKAGYLTRNALVRDFLARLYTISYDDYSNNREKNTLSALVSGIWSTLCCSSDVNTHVLIEFLLEKLEENSNKRGMVMEILLIIYKKVPSMLFAYVLDRFLGFRRWTGALGDRAALRRAVPSLLLFGNYYKTEDIEMMSIYIHLINNMIISTTEVNQSTDRVVGALLSNCLVIEYVLSRSAEEMERYFQREKLLESGAIRTWEYSNVDGVSSDVRPTESDLSSILESREAIRNLLESISHLYGRERVLNLAVYEDGDFDPEAGIRGWSEPVAAVFRREIFEWLVYDQNLKVTSFVLSVVNRERFFDDSEVDLLVYKLLLYGSVRVASGDDEIFFEIRDGMARVRRNQAQMFVSRILREACEIFSNEEVTPRHEVLGGINCFVHNNLDADGIVLHDRDLGALDRFYAGADVRVSDVGILLQNLLAALRKHEGSMESKLALIKTVSRVCKSAASDDSATMPVIDLLDKIFSGREELALNNGLVERVLGSPSATRYVVDVLKIISDGGGDIPEEFVSAAFPLVMNDREKYSSVVGLVIEVVDALLEQDKYGWIPGAYAKLVSSESQPQEDAPEEGESIFGGSGNCHEFLEAVEDRVWDDGSVLRESLYLKNRRELIRRNDETRKVFEQIRERTVLVKEGEDIDGTSTVGSFVRYSSLFSRSFAGFREGDDSTSSGSRPAGVNLGTLKELRGSRAGGRFFMDDADVNASVLFDEEISGGSDGAGDRAGDESDARDDESDARNEESGAKDDESDARDEESDARDDESDARDDESDARDNSSDARDNESDARDDESDTRGSSSDARNGESDTRDENDEIEDAQGDTGDKDDEIAGDQSGKVSDNPG